jgi:RNA polymerase sigma-70 factor (ECF subfamily)
MADEATPDAAPLPDECLARRARAAAFQRLLDQLSEKKRTVYILHELEGLAPAEISRIVDAPVLTVRTRLFYARRELELKVAQDPDLAPLLRQSPEDTEGDSQERES